MPYWCCAQLQPQRTALALHFLSEVEGFTVYYPRLREQRRSYGRKIAVQPGLFPNYAFVWIELGWWRARWSPGVVRIILDGGVPARVADDVIAEIKAREVHGLVELPQRGLVPGDRVRVTQGPLTGLDGLYEGQRPRERVLVLLSVLGACRRVELGVGDVEVLDCES